MTANPSVDVDPSIERHKVIARRWSEELWGKGDLTVADEIIAPDYVRHDAGDPDLPLPRRDDRGELGGTR